MAILLAIQMLHCPTPSPENTYLLKFKFSDINFLVLGGLHQSSNKCADKNIMSTFKNKNDPVAANIFDLDSQMVVVGNGVTEIINAYFSDDASMTGVIMPTFEEYSNRIIHKVRFYPSGKDFAYNLADLINFSDGVDQLLLLNPDNPSGNFLSHEDILVFINHLQKQNKKIEADKKEDDDEKKKKDSNTTKKAQSSLPKNLTTS